jgi:hypothetical protein
VILAASYVTDSTFLMWIGYIRAKHLAGLIAFEMSSLDATFGAILIK